MLQIFFFFFFSVKRYRQVFFRWIYWFLLCIRNVFIIYISVCNMISLIYILNFVSVWEVCLIGFPYLRFLFSGLLAAVLIALLYMEVWTLSFFWTFFQLFFETLATDHYTNFICTSFVLFFFAQFFWSQSSFCFFLKKFPLLIFRS